MRTGLALTLLCFTFFHISLTSAELTLTEVKNVNTGPPANFGAAMVADNDVLVITGGYDSVSNQVVKIYTANGMAWKPLHVLRQPFSRLDTCFGGLLALSPGWLAVGATMPAGRGIVYTFRRQHLAFDLFQSVEPCDHFTTTPTLPVSLAINDTTLAMGAANVQTSTGTAVAGAVYLFKFNGSWTQHQKLAQFGEASFGHSVTITGRHIFVGAPSHNDGQGAVFVFYQETPDTLWATGKTLYAMLCSNFGYSLASDDGLIAIGGPGLSGANAIEAVVVYGIDQDQEPQPYQIIQNPLHGADGSANFGYAVAIYAGLIVAGAPLAVDHQGTVQGGAVVFTFNDTQDAWQQAVDVTAGGFTLTGASVAIHGNIVAATSNTTAGDRVVLTLTNAGCPPGSYSSSFDTCTPCPVGTFTDATGSNTCEVCDNGRFQPAEGQTSCIACGQFRDTPKDYQPHPSCLPWADPEAELTAHKQLSIRRSVLSVDISDAELVDVVHGTKWACSVIPSGENYTIVPLLPTAVLEAGHYLLNIEKTVDIIGIDVVVADALVVPKSGETAISGLTLVVSTPANSLCPSKLRVGSAGPRLPVTARYSGGRLVCEAMQALTVSDVQTMHPTITRGNGEVCFSLDFPLLGNDTNLNPVFEIYRDNFVLHTYTTDGKLCSHLGKADGVIQARVANTVIATLNVDTAPPVSTLRWTIVGVALCALILAMLLFWGCVVGLLQLWRYWWCRRAVKGMEEDPLLLPSADAGMSVDLCYNQAVLEAPARDPQSDGTQ
ncbi:GCC2 and GCC3 [Carpediemonas membranifera]|uniref:GCC2 and GCC3 n=1 Tax=Carpediemonas membranifera TaxID=201153 RepID=A0A8J6DZ81_9EUKA|nr:GCC2 and GCC3 [Carpediemonas membranifera]|eukprot:KAG9390071.1 GCC2 and GCC3 [Carpediemonas membranifera]